MLYGKNAVITGARTGIGRATVDLFAKNGANIWACLRKADPEFQKQAVHLSQKYNVWINTVYIDLESEETIKVGVKEILAKKESIDILVNAAGAISDNKHFHMTSLTDMRHVFEVNFFGVMLLTQLISRAMSKQRKGTITNIASIAGIDGDPAQLEYSASKASIIIATKKLAVELGKYGIRVNAVAPGLTKTKMLETMLRETERQVIDRTIMHRCAEPTEIANAILFFSSDMSSYITGQTLRVDGGM